MSELSPEELAKIEEYNQKWLAIGLSCEPIDFETAKEAVKLVYKDAGFEPPAEIYFTKGPMECAQLCADLRIQKEGLDIKKDSPEYEKLVYKELKEQVCGCHEAGWLAYYDYIWKELGIEECKMLNGLMETAKSCGWWAPYKELAVIQDRPLKIVLNANNRLHNETGPSILFRDGSEIWSLNGMALNEKIIMTPHLLTAEEIDAEANNDVRAVMIQRLGWDKYLAKSGAILLDTRENQVENTIEALYQTKFYGKRFVVTCPTARMFALGVDDDVYTCEQAQKWLGNEDNYDMKVNVIART